MMKVANNGIRDFGIVIPSCLIGGRGIQGILIDEDSFMRLHGKGRFDAVH
jgi:hypothetical protein